MDDTIDNKCLYTYDIIKEEITEDYSISMVESEVDTYEEVEYLEEISDKEELLVEVKTEESQTKQKCPQKLPRHLRNRTYQQYTEEDLEKCVDAVRVDGLSQRQAAWMFNVPRTTLTLKLSGNNVNNKLTKEETYFFHKEIKAILTYTDATPYRFRKHKYSCMYCNTDNTIFQDPNDLRIHMRVKHQTDRVRKVDVIMRPYGSNEIFKVDIKNLTCVECCLAIRDWNKMLHHIESVHNVELEHAYTRIIPYILTEEFRCCLCNVIYTSYIQLDSHMNGHYKNYVCPECGDHYLSSQRLKAHEKLHSPYGSIDGGNFCCDICKKHFTMKKYLRKHIDGFHKQLLNFKCRYCKEKFSSEVNRQNHVQNNHFDKINPIHCELCGKMFLWVKYYKDHIRKRHRGKVHKCSECNKSFYQRYELNEHNNIHKNILYQCVKCQKPYTSKASLRMHVRLKHPKGDDSQKVDAYECKYCSKRYCSNYELTQHTKKLHDNKFKCPNCPKLYGSKSGLTTHIKLKHTDIIQID